MKKYIAEDARAIIRSYAENWIEFKDDGVHYSPDIFTYDPGEELNWKYVLELDGDDAPNPLTAPCLPFPFTAHELAAFMLDGIGAASIPANYAGSWESGPDSGMLESFSRLWREAKRALCEAYAAVHAAEQAIGSSYPLELQKELNRLGDECTNAPLDKDLQKEHSLVEKRYQVAFATWRKAMVNWLLRPETPESIPEPIPAPVQTAGTPGVVDVASEPLATPQPEPQPAALAPAQEEPVTPASDARPWLIPDPRDPMPVQPWYTPARYFARQLVIGDSTLLTKKSILADKVSRSLFNAGFKKRGNRDALDAATVLKAFTNVPLG